MGAFYWAPVTGRLSGRLLLGASHWAAQRAAQRAPSAGRPAVLDSGLTSGARLAQYRGYGGNATKTVTV